jgi:hypothetical protein
MKSLLVRFVSLMMALLLLVSSTGFVIVEHSCQMKGTSQSVWTGDESCKPGCGSSVKPSGQDRKKNTTQLSKQSCCKETSFLSRAELSATVASVSNEVVQIPGINLLYYPLSSLVNRYSIDTIFHSQRPDPGPLVLSVSRYIALLCIWLL